MFERIPPDPLRGLPIQRRTAPGDGRVGALTDRGWQRRPGTDGVGEAPADCRGDRARWRTRAGPHARKPAQSATFVAMLGRTFGSRKRLSGMTWEYVRMFDPVRPEAVLRLRTHVRLKQPIVIQGRHPERPLPGPLVPAARGRLRRRLGGRPGRARPGRWGCWRGGSKRSQQQHLSAGGAQGASARASSQMAQAGGTARSDSSPVPLPHLGIYRRDVRQWHGHPCRRAGACAWDRATARPGSAHPGSQRAAERTAERAALAGRSWRPAVQIKPAASYSPRPLRAKYHRR
jgi:hypothetical protein